MASFLVDAVSRNRRHDKYLIFHTQNEPKIHSLIQFLLCEYFDRSSCYGELIKAYATALFLELVNVMHSQAERTISDSNEILVPVLQYLEKNYKTCTLHSWQKSSAITRTISVPSSSTLQAVLLWN